jgi:hypothetical protein
MRGAANVSLSLDRLGGLRIPLPNSLNAQKRSVQSLERKSEDLANAKRAVEAAGAALDEAFTRFLAKV